MPKVFLELEKLNHLYSGLGQFCLHLGTRIAKKTDVGVYIPKDAAHLFPLSTKVFQHPIHKVTGINVATNIWHSFHQEAVYFPNKKPFKLVITIHDLNFLDKYKGVKRYLHLKRLQKLVYKADAVVFISEYTKSVANEHLNIPHSTLQRVIYNGIAIGSSFVRKPSFIKDNIQPFLFTIGIVGSKKNFHTLVEMMLHLPQLKLYICGNKSSRYAKDIEQKIIANGLQNRVFLTGEITEAEKIWLYKNASAFVFPSKAEGFGLPVAEAMSFGCPLVLSPLTSLPEIGGKVAYYFDAGFQSLKMANIVTKAINEHNSKKRELLISHSKLFDWDKAAQSYIDLYNNLV